MPLRLTIACLLSSCLAAGAALSAAEIPLIANFAMDEGQAFTDQGGIGMQANPGTGIRADAEGKAGGCWYFGGEDRVTIKHGAITDFIGSPFTLAMWIKPEAFPPQKSHTALLSKRVSFWQGYTFQVMLETDGAVNLSAQNGCDTVNVQLGKVPLQAWTHLSFSHGPDGALIGYVNGVEMGRATLEGTLAHNDMPLLVGHADGHDDDNSRRTPYRGRIDELQLYAAELSTSDIAKIIDTQRLPTRTAVKADLAPSRMPVNLKLVRFDMAKGGTNRDGGQPQLSRMTCRRIDDADPVDWPLMWLGEQELFTTHPEQRVMAFRRLHQNGGPVFQQDHDPIIRPGNHWFRPLAWLWGHTFTYTTDTSSRGSTNTLEIWTFPVVIRAAGERGVKTVTLRCDGRTIYQHNWNEGVNSLTLCLPQNTPGPAYELSVNGSQAVSFNAGLKPVTLGDPREEPLPIDLQIAGNPAVTVKNLLIPEFFPFSHDLKVQTAEMRKRSEPWPQATAATSTASGMARHLGVTVPRAPVQTYALSLTHGMSGGFWLASAHAPRGGQNQGKLFPADADGYAQFLAQQNIDVVVEEFKVTKDRTPAQLATACQNQGVRVGFNVISINNANLAYYSRALPDFWLPKLRDAQIVAQRARHLPNFAGLSIGADNGGYVPYWDWAPPIPNRPWGEAFLTVNGRDRTPVQPIGPGLTPNDNKGYEVAGTQREFVEYIQRYDSTFLQYGELQKRVHEVDPSLSLTTGSYGSGPGVGGQGGWPFASINGEPIFAGLDVLQTYDWDETDAEKPLHNLALMDRARSWYPNKPAWMLLDNFFLKHCREARQRIVAIGLTRGLDMIGHNWMPQPTGPHASPQVCADEAEMWGWVHRMSGAYAGTRPRATIGIVFTNDQAISRPIVRARDGGDMTRASHEGKVIEALLLCHLAGWPARIVTLSELDRGLPDDMQALFLTGLNRFDDTWLWSAGHEQAIQAFAKRGGRLILDDESVLPAGLTGTATQIAVHAALPQGPAGPDGDKLALAVNRNQRNTKLLKQAMTGVTEPIVVSETNTVWAVPHRSGDVDYVTVTNWGSSPGRNAMHAYTPATGALRWNTKRPIYDLSLGRKLSAQEAAQCDLRKDAMRVYALPPGELSAPSIQLHLGDDNYLYGMPHVTAAGAPVAGVALEIRITSPDGSRTTLWTASGRNTQLPIARGDHTGTYTIGVTELCSGQKTTAAYALNADQTGTRGPQTIDAAAIQRFLARSDTPLAVAVTKAQRKDPAMMALAQRVVDLAAKAGRTASLKTANPQELIVGVQTYTPAQKHPTWQTIPSDLVLFGDLSSNVLLYDQALGSIFAPEVYALAEGTGLARITYSPFVGNYHCLNLIGHSPAAIAQAVQAIEEIK